jgi:indole-3-glycerol phosphate synthase
VAVIAEIKRRSPSRGDINKSIDAAAQASAYAKGGAAAISVLTEPDYFGGSVDDLASAAAASRLPVLRKDFCLDPIQLLEARAYGAAAVLLIARALQPAQLVDLASEAGELGLEALVEVRSEPELEQALRISGVAIGVNNRDLETLAVDSETSRRLLPLIPATRVAVVESGVRDERDVRAAAALGADAVLVGSALSASQDPTAMVKSLAAVERRPGARSG